jgi:cytochrome c oxidase subunit II
MRNRPLVQMLVIGAIGVAIGIPVALVIPWFPVDGSLQASHVRTLYDVLLVATVPIFVLVETVVLFSVWKFRMRPGDEQKDGPPIHGNTRLEVVWTAVPAILIISLCTYAYTVLRGNEDSKKGEMTVNVIERQFAFEFSYPQAGGKTVVSPVLYLPNNRPVFFRLTSVDVIHSFFVPNFSQKLDAVPGIVTTLRVTPTRLGTYPVECTELCGAGHSLMRTAVRVVTPAAFEAWLSAQPANAPPPIGTIPPSVSQATGLGTFPATSTSGSTAPATTTSSGAPPAASGKAIFTGSGCSGCHTLAAAGATGTVGPNLDQRLRADCATAVSKQKRGPTLSDCIRKAITNPYAYLPSGYQAGIMPSNFSQRLSSSQILALVSYLSSAAK